MNGQEKLSCCPLECAFVVDKSTSRGQEFKSAAPLGLDECTDGVGVERRALEEREESRSSGSSARVSPA